MPVEIPSLWDGMETSDYWRRLTDAARTQAEIQEMDPEVALEFWCQWLAERIRRHYDAVVLITGDEGCWAPETPFLRYDGRTVMAKDVREGDLLMGPDSTPRKVLRTFRGRRPMYRISPRKSAPFEVTDNHPLSVRRARRVYAGKKDGRSKWGWEFEDTVVSVMTPFDYARSKLQVRGPTKPIRFPRQGRPPIAPYLLGVLLGDGGLSGTTTVNVTSADPPIINYLVAEMERSPDMKAVVRYPQPRSPRTARITLKNRVRSARRTSLAYALETLGLFPIRCEDRFVPWTYKVGSVETRRQLLAGLLDTDGTLGRGGSLSFTSKSKQLAEDVAFLARSLGGGARVRSAQKRCQTGAVGTYWTTILTGWWWELPLRLDHKRPHRRDREWKHPSAQSYRVDALGEGEYAGFEVDRDKLVLGSDFLIHHNSGKSSLALRMILRVAEIQGHKWRLSEVCYSALDLVSAYRSITARKVKGWPVWYDEGVRGSSAYDNPLSPESKAIVKSLALVRESGAILFALYPSIWLAAKQIRARRACLWIHVVHRGLGRVHERDKRLNYLPTEALGLTISPQAPHIAWKKFAENSSIWQDYLATKNRKLQEFLHETERDLKMRSEEKNPEEKAAHQRETTRKRVAAWRAKQREARAQPSKDADDPEPESDTEMDGE